MKILFNLLALPVANWSLSIGNITKTSIAIQWPNLTPVLNQPVPHYFGVIKSTNGSFLNGDIISENTSFAVFHGLLPYRRYLLGVVGVNGSGQAYKGSEVTAWTEEGGMYLGSLGLFNCNSCIFNTFTTLCGLTFTVFLHSS